ncbi:transcriptional repressor mpra [Anaeramoeba ignava]|uniref:fructokinase n=1 Tax=Anaeramoeba ignava TaxID=1746090 RepID=A0A9Q0LUG5_ANAIG|nr:transcriptional repressor mpra [Anaeramoeba ignava]
MLQKSLVFAGIEAGGTTFALGIAKGSPTNIIEKTVVDTTNPKETFEKVKSWFSEKKFDGLGIASFGPLELDKSNPKYGYITSTPKPGWKDTNFLGFFKEAFPNIPIGFETDVNAAALAEFNYGGHKELKTCVYVTVGTGIGVGAVVEGNCVHGILHPEVGHIYVPVSKDEEPNFNGTCPFHGCCLEGMACSGSLSKRLGIEPKELRKIPNDHKVWNLFTHYMSHLCVNLTLTYSPNVIILGGGIMQRDPLFPFIRQKTVSLLNGYVAHDLILKNSDQFIVPSKFGSNIGLIGAMEVANLEISKN